VAGGAEEAATGSGEGGEPTAGSWSTRELGEFVGFVARVAGGRDGLERAVEQAAESLDADLGALVSEGRVRAAVGFPADRWPTRATVEAAASSGGTLEIPNRGTFVTIAVDVEADPPHRLLLARSRPQRFDHEEVDLVRGMARVIAVAIRTLGLLDVERALRQRGERQGEENLRLVAALGERQVLLERLAGLQRSIVRRQALPEILEAVAEGARESLRADAVAIRLIGSEDDGMVRLVTSLGASQKLLGRWREARRVDLLSGDVLEHGRATILDSVDDTEAAAEFAAGGLRAAIIAPIHERGRVAGALAIGTRSEQRRFGAKDREVALAFAEHASLALSDARAVEEATHEAFHDSLTGLPNRTLFIDRLEHAMARVGRGGRPVAVLFCDLDGFKTVNDSLGHAAGDRLLAAVAGRLEASLRPADTVARFGGDEFAILLEELGEAGDARHAAGRLLEALRSPFDLVGREVFIAASIGIATTGADLETAAADELLRNADLAMYRAKARGKDRYEVFEPGMHAQVLRRMELEGDLKRAIERDQMLVHYQPIFDLPSGEVSGLEALLRWRHPTAGLIGPNDFVPLAEESGQIRALGRWVLGEACRQLALWRAKYPAYQWLYVSVNLSGVQLREPDLVAEVAAALGAAQLEPEHLMLEMTETVLMEDTETNAARLEAIRALGLRLAIDDFGTGYSSLEYLDRFPIDALKIAKPFVDRLGSGSGSEAIPRAIVDLAEIFGLTVIAEGIERPAQSVRLTELGCRFGQGNHLSPALPPERADAALFGAGLLAEPAADRESDPESLSPPAETERADS
jgi:diguanylate cyclase (GGDEF)-like protein